MTPEEFKDKYTAVFAPNNTGNISEEDLQEFALDISETFGTGNFKGLWVAGQMQEGEYWISGNKIWKTKQVFNSATAPTQANAYWELLLDPPVYTDQQAIMAAKTNIGTEAGQFAEGNHSHASLHQQNTDTGTNSRSFQIGQGAAGGTSTVEAAGTSNDIDYETKPKGAGFHKYGGIQYVVSEDKLLVIGADQKIRVGTSPSAYLTAANLGRIVYVSEVGNDATGLRGRIDKPFLTIQAAVNIALLGDIIYIMPGNYNGTVVVDTQSYGAQYPFKFTFVLDNATLTGGFTNGFTNSPEIYVVGRGVSKIIGKIEQTYPMVVPLIDNLTITQGVTVGDCIIKNCNIIYPTGIPTTSNNIFQDCVITSNTYLAAGGYIFYNTNTFLRCKITCTSLGEYLVNGAGKIIFDKCTVKCTNDALPASFNNNSSWGIYGRDSSFEFGTYFYQTRGDDLPEDNVFQNCLFYSRAGTQLLLLSTGANGRATRKIEFINCVSNVPVGETTTAIANFVQTSFTNF